jgi:hypothetical protein
MWSLADRALLLDDGVTLTLTEGLRDSAAPPLPPSKYSINNEVWLLFEPRPLSRFFVEIVTGVPSEGREYVVFSVTLDSTSVPPVLLSVSVGAGSGGAFRESTPILVVEKSDRASLGLHRRCDDVWWWWGDGPTVRRLGKQQRTRLVWPAEAAWVLGVAPLRWEGEGKSGKQTPRTANRSSVYWEGQVVVQAVRCWDCREQSSRSSVV